MKPPNDKTQDAILRYLQAAIDHGTQNQAMRYSFEKIDQEYAREKNYEKEHLKAKNKNNAGQKRILQDITVPVIYPQT